MTLKLAYFGHIMSGSPLALQIVEGMVEGKRKRGRRKKKNNGLTTSENGQD